MNYQPRTIAFLSEAHHAASPPDARAIQKLHNQMFEAGHPLYSSFAVTPSGPVLTNPSIRTGHVSQVAFLPDRVQFREELGALTEDDFGQRLEEVLQAGLPLRGVDSLKGHQVVLRSLINPHSHQDSREFLASAVFRFQDKLETLGATPQLHGLRMVIPPEGPQQRAFAVRVESYTADLRSLFIEIQGTFGPVPLSQGLNPLRENVFETYRFLTERVLPFVARFDRQDAGGN